MPLTPQTRTFLVSTVTVTAILAVNWLFFLPPLSVRDTTWTGSLERLQDQIDTNLLLALVTALPSRWSAILWLAAATFTVCGFLLFVWRMMLAWGKRSVKAPIQ